MKMIYKIVLSLSVFMVFLACGQSDSFSSTSQDQNTQTQQKSESKSYDGSYVFDIDTFQKEILKDERVKNLSKEHLQKMTEQLSQKFKDFNIVITGTSAQVTLKEESFKGTLKEVSNQDGQIKLLMTPVDPDKKDEIAYFIVKGNVLSVSLDQDDKKGEKLYLHFLKKS